MIDQGSTGIFSIPAKLAVEICNYTQRSNTHDSSQRQNPSRIVECDQFPNQHRPLIYRDSDSVNTPGANAPPYLKRPQKAHHQERRGFQLSKMRSAINVRPRTAILQAGNALVKSISTVFLKKPKTPSTRHDVPPMRMDPYLIEAADINPTCLYCCGGHTNQRSIGKFGEDNSKYEYQPSDGSYAGDEYFFSDDEEEEEEEVKPIILHGLVPSAS